MTPAKSKGLRLDGWLPDQERTQYVMDVTFTHQTKASLKNTNVNWFRKELEAEQASRRTGAANPYEGKPSFALEKACDTKHVKYSLATTIDQMQFHDKIRPTNVEFLSPGVTHLGEMGGDFFTMIERLVTDYKNNPVYAPENTGFTKPRVVATFRATCKDAIACTLVHGVGQEMSTTGVDMWTN